MGRTTHAMPRTASASGEPRPQALAWFLTRLWCPRHHPTVGGLGPR